MKGILQTSVPNKNYIEIINSLLISIVLYLHHASYTNNYYSILNEFNINLLLQKFAVGGFFFFSGLKLALSNIDYPISKFIKKRLLRIYILYVFALIIASFTYYPFFNNGNFPGIKNFVLHLFCLQTLFPNLFGTIYLTIWFVSILIFCYSFFLFTRKDITNTKVFIIKMSSIFIIISLCYLVTYENSFKVFTKDFAIYIMFFALGMFFSRTQLVDNKYLCIVIGVTGSTLLLIIYNTIYINTWYEYFAYSLLVVSSNISLLYLLCIMLRKVNLSRTTMKLIGKYSSASFCVFLFHRSIWSIMATIWSKGTFMQWLFIIALGIPAIIVLSYFIQYSYNLTMQYCTTRRST